MIPPARREFFYALVEGFFPAYLYETSAGSDKALHLSMVEGAYAGLALATLDLGLGAKAARPWLAELARASQLSLELFPADARALPALRSLLAFQAVVTPDATRRYARALLARPRREPMLDALVDALCSSIVGDDKAIAAALRAARGTPPSSRRTAAAWFAALRELAHACLVAEPRDPSALVRSLADATHAYLARDFEDQVFDSVFGTIGLAFIARARDRGLALDGAGPHPAYPYDVLRLPRRALPKRRWDEWPRPDETLHARVSAARG